MVGVINQGIPELQWSHIESFKQLWPNLLINGSLENNAAKSFPKSHFEKFWNKMESETFQGIFGGTNLTAKFDKEKNVWTS